jgi:hypothetical protein
LEPAFTLLRGFHAATAARKLSPFATGTASGKVCTKIGSNWFSDAGDANRMPQSARHRFAIGHDGRFFPSDLAAHLFLHGPNKVTGGIGNP